MGVTNRGGVWYVKWKTATGVWVRRATTAQKKSDAQALHAEFVNQVARQKAGLEPRPPELGYTLWSLTEWWLKKHVSKRSQRRHESIMRLHVKEQPHGAVPIRQVNAQLLEPYFDALEKRAYAPRTINLIRAYLISVFERARKAGLWAGDNPVSMTTRRKVPVAPRPTLTAAEVELVIANVFPTWRSWFAAACWLGLRKGELAGLKKTDYDQVARTVTVARSYEHEGQKGNRVDVLPVSRALAPYLAAALKSPGPYMFPNPAGGMRTEHCGPEDILRAALRRAGLVEGWRYSCRRCKHRSKTSSKVKPHVETHPKLEERRCPECNMVLFPKALVRDITAHDMRHTCATLLLKAGVAVQHVQRILRHSSIKVTVDTYGHLLTEDLRAGVEKLGPQPVQRLSQSQTA
jgi:integrase